MTEEEKRQHRCCFAGHRPEILNHTEEAVIQWLSQEIDNAVKKGFTTFITGMAMGVDLWAAEIVIRKKQTNDRLRLIAAAPYPTFPAKWNDEWKQRYSAVWHAADYQLTVSSGYSSDAFRKRCEWMVDRCGLVIACHNGSGGSTGEMLVYAQSIGVSTVILSDEPAVPSAYPGGLLEHLSPNTEWPDDIDARLTVSFYSLQSVRDITALEKRYKEGKTLRAIGEEMRLSAERIRQLLTRSDKRLRNDLPFLRGEQTDDEKLLKKEWLLKKMKTKQ